MNAKQPTPSLTWDWHFAAFGLRPRLTITWAFGCGLLAVGTAPSGQGLVPIMIVAAWLVADPFLGAIATHLVALRELRSQMSEVVPPHEPALAANTLPFIEANSPGGRAANGLRSLFHNLRAFPGLTGHSLSAVATAIAGLIMSVFISPTATVIVGVGLLLTTWTAIFTHRGPADLAETSGGVQTASAFLIAITVMGAFSWKFVLLAALLGLGAASRPTWLRTGRSGARLAVMIAWLGITAGLLYTRQPVPAVLVACSAIADQLNRKDDPAQAAGYFFTQVPWLATLALVGLAASQWG
ncbi:MAG: hypothetical protein ACYCZF_04940 [Anaerolineae bacterium]